MSKIVTKVSRLGVGHKRRSTDRHGGIRRGKECTEFGMFLYVYKDLGWISSKWAELQARIVTRITGWGC